MVVPAARLSLPPLRKIKETVPSVVGFQFNVRVCPALAESPAVGMVNGFALLSAARTRKGALRTASRKERGKSILASKCLFGSSVDCLAKERGVTV